MRNVTVVFFLSALVLVPIIYFGGASARLTTGPHPAPQSPTYNSGSVEGQVVTGEGRPVAQAKVYARKIGESQQIERLTVVYTDEQGRFTLSGLLAGEYLICAFKEDDDYPDLTFSFYSVAYRAVQRPRILIQDNQVVRDVVVRLGPKAGRLLVKVLDARTKNPIKDAEVALNHKDNPMTLLKSGPTELDGSFRLLVPSFMAVNMVVSAPDYRSWRYGTNGTATRTDAIVVKPGSERQIIVELDPSKPHNR